MFCGETFDNLKFFHKQTEGNSRSVIHAASLFGSGHPPQLAKDPATSRGNNYRIELSETTRTAASTSLEPQALAAMQEEFMAYYAAQQRARYPPPPSYHQQPPRTTFMPAAGPAS